MAAIPMHRSIGILFLALPFMAPTAHGQDAYRAVTTTKPGYTPLTQADRNKLFLKDLFNPFSFVESAASAGWGQLRDKPAEWREGGEGYGKRYASSFAQHATQETLQYGIASLLHEDNRYVPSGRQRIPSRVLYALVSTFRSRDDQGERQMSYSTIGSLAGASLLSRTWQPASTGGAGNGAVNFGVAVAFAAGMNVAHEFLHR